MPSKFNRQEFLKRLKETSDPSGQVGQIINGPKDPLSLNPDQGEAAQRERSMRALQRLGATGSAPPADIQPRQGISMDEMDQQARAQAQKLVDDQMALKEPQRPQYANDEAYYQAMDPYQHGQQLTEDPDYRNRFIEDEYKKNYEALRKKHLGQ